MNMNPFTDMPVFVKKEIELLNERLAPTMRVASRYSLFSFPLVVFSIMNIIIVLFTMPMDENTWITLLIYSILGAVGMALSKESKIRRKAIEKISVDYMIQRINESKIATEQMKKRYIIIINEKPVMALAQFMEFLREEQRRSSF
ncbi:MULTISPECIES: DUF5392 family protein [Cytobacillus]|uniref:DUF5392 family protein n=1 Tax=Cytobacillus TaxID=2675230 RepID=UPI001CD3A91C|nr:DUF5392 family protein [Cytobacillus kochii]MCA1024737.1 YwnF family protein [Cytobacillus kochii]MCM3323780.1 YwnF family protein [Cytobacillus kochii]MCM3346039.1 YwnF family protein [Cytobacillus kochii]MDM5206430.1 DUF5392 family protein [Cytobacillus kochii]